MKSKELTLQGDKVTIQWATTWKELQSIAKPNIGEGITDVEMDEALVNQAQLHQIYHCAWSRFKMADALHIVKRLNTQLAGEKKPAVEYSSLVGKGKRYVNAKALTDDNISLKMNVEQKRAWVKNDNVLFCDIRHKEASNVEKAERSTRSDIVENAIKEHGRDDARQLLIPLMGEEVVNEFIPIVKEVAEVTFTKEDVTEVVTASDLA